MTDDYIPFFTSDQWSADPNALLRTYGEWYQPKRQGRRGPHPALRCRPRPNLLYAQVVKRREKGRVVEAARKIIGPVNFPVIRTMGWAGKWKIY